MRALLFATIAIVTLAGLAPASAQTRDEDGYPWCAHFAGPEGDGGTNCGFDSFAQCRASLQGVGGFCYENPRVADRPLSPVRRRTR